VKATLYEDTKEIAMRRLHVIAVAAALLVMISASGCSSAPTAAAPTPAPAAAPSTTPAPTTVPAAAGPTAAPAAAPTAASAAAPPTAAPAAAPTTAPVAVAPPADVVVYASDLQKSALTDELDFVDDPASPGGKMIALPNTGDKLNAPPEDDPHVTFPVQVQVGVPYRCWMHMKVGTPKGVSQANRLYVQFSDALDKANQPVFTLGTGSYMTAQGPEQEGWTWVGCDSSDPEAPESLLYFRTGDKVTVRLQAGMEGVGFDQFLLSSARFLQQPPSEAVVQK
jgi:hypothetical protein